MSIKRVVLVILVCLLTGLLVLQSQGVPSLLQYAFLPPDEIRSRKEKPEEENKEDDEEQEPEEGQKQAEEETPLSAFLKSWETFLEDQGDAVSSAALTAHYPSADLSLKKGGNAQAELTAVYGELHALKEDLLLNGRHLYQEEVDRGAAVAVIDEALAIALFRQGSPVNLEFTLNNQTFRVVGVIKRPRNVGDRAEQCLYVPLKAFKNQPDWELLIAQLRTTGGTGTRNGVSAALAQWRPGGESIDLIKEKYRATLPVRVLLCVLGFLLALFGVRLASRASSALIQNCKERLKEKYAIRLLPRFIGVGLLIAIMFGLGVGAMIYAFARLLDPVYVFPEWVPVILVEPREIARTFWNNQTANNGLLSLRSRELNYLRNMGGFITALTLLLTWALILPLNKLFSLVKKEDESE